VLAPAPVPAPNAALPESFPGLASAPTSARSSANHVSFAPEAFVLSYSDDEVASRSGHHHGFRKHTPQWVQVDIDHGESQTSEHHSHSHHHHGHHNENEDEDEHEHGSSKGQDHDKASEKGKKKWLSLFATVAGEVIVVLTQNAVPAEDDGDYRDRNRDKDTEGDCDRDRRDRDRDRDRDRERTGTVIAAERIGTTTIIDGQDYGSEWAGYFDGHMTL
jgi:hypothetical protein